MKQLQRFIEALKLSVEESMSVTLRATDGRYFCIDAEKILRTAAEAKGLDLDTPVDQRVGREPPRPDGIKSIEL